MHPETTLFTVLVAQTTCGTIGAANFAQHQRKRHKTAAPTFYQHAKTLTSLVWNLGNATLTQVARGKVPVDSGVIQSSPDKRIVTTGSP